MPEPSYARNVAVLAACQALFFMANTVVISTTALIGLQYAPAPELSSLALGVQFAGTMAATMPASLLMQRWGRRPGFVLGGVIGVAAGVLGCLAILRGSFLGFCAASLLYGVFGAFCQFLRFAAADVAALPGAGADPLERRRGRAIAWVMAGGTVAALLGPLLARSSQDLLAPVPFAGCFVVVAVLAGLLALAATRLDPLRPLLAARRDPGRPLLEIARQPAAVTAFLAALVAYVTMNLLMTATPLAMAACGFGFAETATVIQWHVLGMFAPSLATGWLVGRLGARGLIFCGVALMAACVGVALAGVQLAHFAAALFCLGVGWNFMFIGATTLLTGCHAESEKGKVQGLNDSLVFTTVAVSASAAGVLHHLLGWGAMNLIAAPGLLLVTALMLVRVGPPLALPRRGAAGGR